MQWEQSKGKRRGCGEGCDGRPERKMADRLKFGYFTLSDNSVGYGDRRRDPGELIKDVVNQAIAAEGLGYNSAWFPEHHFGFFGVLPTPAQALTFTPPPPQTFPLPPPPPLL